MLSDTLIPPVIDQKGKPTSLWHTRLVELVALEGVRSEFWGENIKLSEEEKAMPPARMVGHAQTSTVNHTYVHVTRASLTKLWKSITYVACIL